MSRPVLRAKDLVVARPGGPSWRIPSLEVQPGGRIALCGPSGSGKTTLLAAFAGRLPARSGSLHVEGRELVGASESVLRAHRLKVTGQAMQDAQMIPYLSLIDNVLLPLRLAGRSLGASHRTRAQELLARLGLGPRSRSRPAQLSHGERSRVAIARALIASPPLLLIDEPTASLDPSASGSALDLIFSAEGAVVFATHDPDLIARVDHGFDTSSWRVS